MCIQLYANIISFEFTFFVKSARNLDMERQREQEGKFYMYNNWPDVISSALHQSINVISLAFAFQIVKVALLLRLFVIIVIWILTLIDLIFAFLKILHLELEIILNHTGHLIRLIISANE